MSRAAYLKNWYQKNKASVLLRNKIYWRLKRAIVIKAKRRPCTDCHRRYPHYVMDFDHVRGHKVCTIGHLKGSVEKLLAEIAKCEVVCANCHRERTFKRRGF